MLSKYLIRFSEAFKWNMHPTPFQNTLKGVFKKKGTKIALPGIWQKFTPEQDSLFLPIAEALWLEAQLDGRCHTK